MRINMLMVSAAASLLLSAVADASAGRDGSAGTAEMINSTGLPWNVQTLQRVSPETAGNYPKPDWTSAIGTGKAAAVAGRPRNLQPVSPASPRRYPKPDWTAAIGTGAAAAASRI